jgi:uncharacterized repeat protein (TIGR02059 family)
MDAAKTVTATFAASAILKVETNGTGAGLVQSIGTTGLPVDGIDCGGADSTSVDCYEIMTPVPPATIVILMLRATPEAGSTFVGWSGICSGTGLCPVSGGGTVTATFSGPTLYVSEAGSGMGRVTSIPTGIDCHSPDSCSKSYNRVTQNVPATEVLLTATPDNGNSFDASTGWSGCDSVVGVQCKVTMNTVKSVVATFTKGPYTLTVLSVGTGAGKIKSNPAGIDDCGTPMCTAHYSDGALVVITATPITGSTFTGWGGDCTGIGTCIVTMDKAKSVIATFDSGSSSSNYTLTVLGAGSGAGSIKSAPTGIDCTVLASTPTVCSAPYASSSVVALTAAAAANNTFVGWGGDCTGTGTCVVTMDKAKNVTATFDSVATSEKKTLFLYKLGTGSGAVTSDPTGIDCPATGCANTSASFAQDASVKLTATHAQGSSFTGWSGGGSARAVSNVAVNGTAKTVTLTLASAVSAGQSIALSYTDPTSGNDGNAIQDIYGSDAASVPVSSVTNRTGAAADTTRPSFALATVNGKTLVMSYTDASYNLDATKIPDATAFTVKVDNNLATVSAVLVTSASKTVTLTLAAAVTAGQSVNVAYTAPSASPIQDTQGNIAASLGDTTVSNLSGAPVGTLPPAFALAVVNGDQLVLSYVGPTDLDAVNLPSLGTFAVQVGDADGCIGTAITCQVTMSTARTVTATFDGVSPAFFTVHIGKLGTGSGTIKTSGVSQDPINCGNDCDGSFTLGTPVVLKALAESNSNFDGWESGCKNTPSKNEDCYVLKTKVDIERDGTSYGVTVSFSEAVATTDFRTLWVTKQGAGTGSISSTSTAPDLPKQKQVNCGGTCTVDYLLGTSVTLTASPAVAFTGWKGACTGSLTTCTVTMESGKSVIATFIPSVSADLAGTGHGLVTSQPSGINCGSGGSCSAVFSGYASAILTATPATGSVFTGWAGPCTGSAAACTVGTSVTQSVTATFSLSNPANPPTVPSAPLIAAAKPGPASAQLSIAPPVPDNTLPIIRYDARCQTANRPPVTASSAASPIIVRRLTPRATYLCSATAVNDIGASSPSAAVSVTPLPAGIHSILMLLLD